MEGTSRNHVVQLRCSKGGQLEKFSQGYVQSSFEYIKEQKLHNIFGLFVPAFDDSPCKNFCLMFKWNLLYFNLHSLPLLLTLGTTKKGLLSLSPSIRYFQTLLRHYWTFFSPSCWTVIALSASICQMLQCFNHLCGPSLSLLQNISLLLAHAGMGIALQMWSQIVLVQEMDCFPLLGNALLQPAQEAAGCTCHIHHLSRWLRWGWLPAWSSACAPSWRLGWHSLDSSSQEPLLITRPFKDNWEYPYNDICHFLSILRCTLPKHRESCMSLLAPNFTSLSSSPWFG